MPKTVKKPHKFEVGDRVIYTKNNKETECWIEKINRPYIVLRPCFKSIENILIHQLQRDAENHIKKFKGRHPKINQLILYDNYKIQRGIIIDISKPNMTIQIIGTRINYTVDINCCSVNLLNLFKSSYIPYFPINLKMKPPLLYKDVIVNEIRGTICDYDEFHHLYLFLYWINGFHKIQWVTPDQITNHSSVIEDKIIQVHKYEFEFNSVYPEKAIPYIIKHSPKLILMDFMKNMSWWEYRTLNKILELYFITHYRCKQFSGYIKMDSLDIKIIEELVKNMSEQQQIYIKHQYMTNMRINMPHDYKFSSELIYRSKPYFDLKLSRKDKKFVIDVYFNQSINVRGISSHVYDLKINPIINHFNPHIKSRYLKWENINTSNIDFWEDYWGKQIIQDTKHSILYPHQVWSVKKMEKMEKQNISNIFNFNIWNKNYNILCGFIDKTNETYGGILALDTGLGKTLCCIELIKRNPSKTLIVVPLTLLDQWKMEIQHYYPEASVSEFYGKKKSSDGLIILTTYGTMLQNIPPEVDRVIFDECHTLKSCFSSTAHSCGLIKASKRWCVTATPFENSLESIQPLLKLLNIYPWKTMQSNCMEKLMTIWKPALGYLIDNLFIKLNREILTKLNMNPIFTNIRYKDTDIRMNYQHNLLYKYLKDKIKDAIKQLIPYPRNYYKVIMLYNQLHMAAVDPKILDITYYAKTVEGGMRKKTLESMDPANTFQKNVVENFKDQDQCVICMEPYNRPTITPCFHIFCHDCIKTSIGFKKKCPQCRAPVQKNGLTEMVKKIEIKENKDTITFFDIHNNQKEIPKKIHTIYQKDIVSNKLNYIVHNIKNKPDVSFIVFSQFNICLIHLQKQLIKENIHVDMINGRKSRVQRKKAIQDFKDKKIQVFLLSTKTASIGLTLTTSYHMIFMEPILDNQVFKQAVGRIFRIGQENNVIIETLYSSDSIEKKDKIDQFKKSIENKKKIFVKKMKMSYLHSMLEMD